MKRTNLWLAGTLVLAAVMVVWLGKGQAAAEPVLPGSEDDPLVSRSYVDAKLRVFVVEVPAGKELIGSAGTEIIVRSGSAAVIDSELGGLCDITAGRDLRLNEQAPANHLLIVPRDDGRGIKAETALFVLIRGSYKLLP